METTTPETTTQTDVRRRRLQGVVVKTAMKDTITVLVERLYPHRRLRRVMRRSRKYLVHDPKAEANVGDTVTFEETRPISKRKRHRLVEITQRAPAEEAIDTDDEDIAPGQN